MSLRRSLVLIAAVVVLPLTAACAPPEAPPAPGGWPGATCLNGNGQNNPDIKFSGRSDVRGNGTLSGGLVNGTFVFSDNGSCSGPAVAALTIVRADDAGAATAVCTALGAGTDTAAAFANGPYTLPQDAYACSETYFL